MKPRDNDKMQTYWKNQASKFADLYSETSKHLSLKKITSTFLGARTEALNSLADFDKNSVILDLGCGSGIHMKLFSPRCKEISGVDFSMQMISVANRELSGLSTHNWQLKCADAQNLPFREKTFDWIISMGLLDYVPDPKQVITECYRVLKPNGLMLFSIPKKPSMFALLRTPIGNLIKKTIFDLPPVGNIMGQTELKNLLHSTGFELCHLRSIWTTMWLAKVRKHRQ